MALFFECYPGLEQMKMWSSLHMAVLNIIIGIASSSRTTLKTFLTHIGKPSLLVVSELVSLGPHC